MRIFRRDLEQFYNLGSSPESNKTQITYRAFAQRQRLSVAETQELDFWRTELEGAPQLIDLPFDYDRPKTPSFDGGFASIEIPDEVASGLKRISRELNTTLYTVLLSAFDILLHKYSGVRDLVVGSPITDRNATDVESVIGFFNNTILLRCKVNPDESFTDMVITNKKTVLNAFGHRNLPYEQLVRELAHERSLQYNPLFQVMFLFNDEKDTLNLGQDIEVNYTTFDLGVSKFDLTLYCEDVGGKLSSTFEYSSDLWDHRTIETMANSFVNLLSAIVNGQYKQIRDLSLLSDRDISKLKSSWRPIAHPYDGTVVDALFQNAKDNPEQVALVDAKRSMTYREVVDDVLRVSAALQENGCSVGDGVGLLMDRSVNMITAIFGILHAGCFYMPMDPKYPVDRLTYMVEDSAISMLLTSDDYVSHLPLSGVTKLSLDRIGATAVMNIPNRSSSQEPAYTIYTSGSSGRPKGVQIKHYQLAQSNQARVEYYDDQPGRFLLMSSFSFDSSVVGIFWPLYCGGTLVIPPERIEQDMIALSEFIESNAITHTLLLPTLYGMLLDIAGGNNLDSLRSVIVAGEACDPRTVRNHFQAIPECQLYNEYGPTEATVWATVHKLKSDEADGRIPIGMAIPGTRVYVVNNGQLVPQGAAGNMYIAGATVADGYTGNAPGNESFVRDFVTDDGSLMYNTGDRARVNASSVIEFLGRSDAQLKIRGYRIEIDEVRRQHLRIAGVDDAAVVAKPHAKTSQLQLHSFVVSSKLTPREVRAELTLAVPEHMIPTSITELDSLPKLPNGKVDSAALFALQHTEVAQHKSAAPRNELETAVHAVWKEVLGVDQIGVADNFFELGGDSIMSIQILSRLKAKGYNLAPNDIFNYQTIELLALRVSEQSERLSVKTSGHYQLLPIQEWFFATHLNAPSHWNQVYRIELTSHYNSEIILDALEDIRHRHPALRSRFVKDDNGWKGLISEPDFPLTLIPLQDEGVSEVNKTLDITKGDVMKCLYDSRANTIYLILHHLVVDAVSWQVILKELDDRLQGTQGQAVPTDSLLRWSEELWNSVPSNDSQEVIYWVDQLAGVDKLRYDHDIATGHNEGDARAEQMLISAEKTAAFLAASQDTFRVEHDEITLAAIMYSIVQLMGGNDFTVFTELHGRESRKGIDSPGDLVGWLTSMFPMRLKFSPAKDLLNIITTVKDARRLVPDGGLGYGLNQGKDGTWDTSGCGLLYNYLGTTREDVSMKSFRSVEVVYEGARSPNSERQFPLELNCSLNNAGQLCFTITYSKKHFELKTIEQFKSGIATAIDEIISSADSYDKSTVSASDFPESGLSGDDLNTLLGSI